MSKDHNEARAAERASPRVSSLLIKLSARPRGKLLESKPRRHRERNCVCVCTETAQRDDNCSPICSYTAGPLYYTVQLHCLRGVRASRHGVQGCLGNFVFAARVCALILR